MKLPDSLKPCSEESLEKFKHAENDIIEKATIIALEIENDIEQMGDDAREKLISGLQMTHKMLESIMLIGDTALLKDQLDWGHHRLPSQGISPYLMFSTLEIYNTAVNQLLPEKNAREISPYIQWMIEYQRTLLTT